MPNRSSWSTFLSGSDVQGAQVYIDPRSGNPSSIVAAVPLIPGSGASNNLTLDDVAAAIGAPLRELDGTVVAALVRRFVEDQRGVLGVELEQLGEVRAVPVNAHLWQIHIPQQYLGIPVRYGRVVASISHGNLVLIGTDTWSNVTISPVPLLDATQALEVGFGFVGGRLLLTDFLLREPTLEVVPYAPAERQRGEAFAGPVGSGYGHRLVWSFVFTRPPDLGQWEVMVDAHTGTVLSLQDINQYAEQDSELHAEQQIKGAVFPLTSTEACPDPTRCGTAQPGYPMPFADTGLAAPNNFTNSGGVFDHTGGQVTTTLTGKYVRINDRCGPINETSATGGIDLGGTSSQHDCASAGQSAGDTSASRSAFYELNKIAEEARGWLPTNAWLQSQVSSNVNINATCNAFWNGASVNFYRSGGGCRNTGEIAAVFDHEWGHGLDDNDSNGTLSSSSEAYADIAAIYRLQASCVGYGFFHTMNTGCGQTADGTGFNANESQVGASHCDLNCSGVRDADWGKHADQQPDTALGFVCSSCGGGNGPCGRQVHCAAAPARQAAWDLVARDLRAAPFNLDRHTAFIIGDKLFYQGSGNVTAWHSCSCGQSSNGCAASNGYMQWLAVDDDNGNLNDGTPHMTAIHAAFDRHGIACASPTPTNSGCGGGPTAAPTVTVTRGQGQNQLSWTSVPNAATYRVFRTEGHAGCNFGKVLLAEVAGTSYSDTAVAGSRDYCYNVMAVGTSGACFGPASACACTSQNPSPDFTLSCSPTTLSIQRGSSGTSTCTLASQNGFSSAVTLSCQDLPAGVTCGYNPNPATPPANASVNSTLTVSVATSASTGTTTIKARGVSGALDKTFSISLQVTDQPPAADFTLQCAPSSFTLRRGESGTSTCTVASQNGFSSAVSLDCLDLPSGVTCGYSPGSVTPPANGSANSTLTVNVAASAPAGAFTIKARGRSGALDRRFDVALRVSGAIPCQSGDAGGYPCKDVDLMAHLPLSAIGGGSGSSNWGWTDPQTGKEYALMGRSNGTSFVDISDPEKPIYLGNLPSHTGSSPWREMKVYQNHAYIVSDQNGAHGMQIFDLTQLRALPGPPVVFTETAHYAGFQRAHNMVINETTGFAYAVGTETCSGGLHMMGLQNPRAPTFVGCFSADGYTHDAQCVVYNGPDAAHRGQEICFASNEDTVSLVNVQNKNAPSLISRKSYPGVGYVHQGWLTEDHRYFLQDDELDEQRFGHNSRTYMWDMADLTQPVLMGFYEGPTRAVDHNLYVKGNFAYEANYRAGLRILSLQAIGSAQLREVAYFDIYPADDSPEFNGAWNNYPFYASGLVTVAGIEQGLFILKPRLESCSPPPAPSPVRPPDGTGGVSLTPVLDWSDVIEAGSYEVQVATDPNFASVVRSATNLSASTWTVSPALDGGLTFYWRARAVNVCGPGAWTARWSFTTVANRPPVLDPVGDKTVAEGSLLSFTVSASDPDGDALTYRASGLPPGASFDASTRSFGWTPTFDQAGSYPAVTFEVSDGRGGADSEAITITVTNTNRPPLANAGPDQSVSVNTRVTLDGSGSSDPDGDPLGYAWRQLSGPPVGIDNPDQARAAVTPATAGSYVFELKVSDGVASSSDQVTVTVTGGANEAVYDPLLKAPKCGTAGSSCDSGPGLLLGRDGKGPEPNQPNTINDSCADGTSGTFHFDESNDRIVVSTVDGSDFAPGKTVRIDATVWAWTTPSADHLDLYSAANANSPSWTFIATLTPTVAGAQTLSATYTLPSGSLQAVRARFRYQGSAASCGTGSYNDHDDLVFAVGGAPPVTTVFEDDFETDKGWTPNPSGTDTATTGLWERGDPEATSYSGPKQLGTTVSGVNDLVTGRLAGSSVGVHDVDGGVTSIQSPAIALPSTGSLALSFSYYLAHVTNSSTADFLRVKIVGATTTTVFEELGAADNDDAVWATASVSLGAFAGQTISIRIEAADAGEPSLVEAAVDDLKVIRQ